MKFSYRTFSWLYALMFPLVYAFARLFYRRWALFGRERFPKSGEPVLIVSNHQNALIDPLLCCLTAPRQLHFLTRADVFRNKVFRYFVLALNMLPVYRVHDHEDGKKDRNERSFRAVIRRMQRGAVVGIFPEGNHGNRKVLRPLKKGLAQLLEMMGERDPKLRQVKVMVMGVDYDDYDRARSSVVVNFGEPFQVDDLLFGKDGDTMERYRAVMHRVREKMEATILHLGPDRVYPYMRMAEVYLLEHEGYADWPEVHRKLSALREKMVHDDSGVLERAKTCSEQLVERKLPLKAAVQFALNRKPPLVKAIVLGLPALPGFLLNAPGWQLALWATRRAVVDPHFNSTFRLLFGMLAVLLTWAMLIAVSFSLLPAAIAAVLLGVLFVSSLIALPFSDALVDCDLLWRAERVFKHGEPLLSQVKALISDLEKRV